LGGFSLYEVAGAYQGQTQLYTEQTLVVRLVFELGDREYERERHEAKIHMILDEIVRITGRTEEGIWVIRTPAAKQVWLRNGVSQP